MLKGAVLVIYDITEFKNLEVMRKDFVANVSHELKTPITSIKGFSETLMDGASEDPETRDQFLKIIYDESKRIQLLIDDLLILSQLEKEESNLTVTAIHVDFMLDEIFPIVEQQAATKDISYSVDADRTIVFNADEEKIKQIILNLLMNAISYTPEKGSISLGVEDVGDHICFTVTDSGIGIGKDYLPRIFERFYRVDKDRSRDIGGTELGVSIVKQ